LVSCTKKNLATLSRTRNGNHIFLAETATNAESKKFFNNKKMQKKERMGKKNIKKVSAVSNLSNFQLGDFPSKVSH
jgi:hypothetical protein